jgi:hypothetical protein
MATYLLLWPVGFGCYSQQSLFSVAFFGSSVVVVNEIKSFPKIESYLTYSSIGLMTQ